ncbi:hypothetical protein AD937_05065 [Gluconobacter japonicus]|nr:hypothetical protein AD937_05065 [Gluconobacter japonicus]
MQWIIGRGSWWPEGSLTIKNNVVSTCQKSTTDLIGSTNDQRIISVCKQYYIMWSNRWFIQNLSKCDVFINKNNTLTLTGRAKRTKIQSCTLCALLKIKHSKCARMTNSDMKHI